MKSKRHRVWVVDDNKLHAQMVTRAFHDNTDVEIFGNGAALLEHMSSAGPLADAVVLDWKLPDMTGLEVCRFVRNSYDEVTLPILILTSSGNKSDVVEGLGAGANDYVIKPFDPMELRARVGTLLRVKHLQDDRKKAEQDREHYRELMLGMLGHDLRAPLSAIAMGADSMLMSESTSEGHTRVLARMKSSTGRMARMIEQILDFTRSRFGGIPLDKREMDLSALVEQCAEELSLATPESRIEVKVSGACHMKADSDRLTQALTNLFSNAHAHGSPGTPIDVAVICEGDHVRVTVHNRGEPIPENMQQTIFDPFRRGEQRSYNVRKGLGLGLYITRQVVEAHGGTVDVDSTLADGTTFTLTLPRERT
jgi:phosphoserine phosphatase RsbU/P